MANDPWTPEASAATVFEKLGIDRDKPLYTASDRPVFIGHEADPIAPLM